MMKILVTGGRGQLGQALRNETAHSGQIQNIGLTVSFLDHETLDLTDKVKVEDYFASNVFDVVINCAAYTNVDKAETDREGAIRGNVEIVENIASIARKMGTRLIHISTDYVFDGRSMEPYKESDPTNPQSVYGKTKLEGEKRLMDECPDAVIVRTAWLYSSYGRNFYLTMRNKALAGESVRVVNDQTGCPTLADDLASTLLKIATVKEWKPGVYHYSNEGTPTTWHEFTKEIYHLHGADSEAVKPISAEEYGAPAPRPKYSVLDTNKIKEAFGIEIPEWKESLKKTVENGNK